MSETGSFTIHLEQIEDYQFKVKFDFPKADELLLDEPQPLGLSEGPNASRLLAAAAANCLSASLLFCLTKTLDQIPAHGIRTEATGKLVRDEKQRLRIGGIDVKLIIGDELESAARLPRCLQFFEDFCVVSASIRQGIPIAVEVCNEAGDILHRNA
jgi:organic hydroperoxide reductase OsmC/OhrA